MAGQGGASECRDIGVCHRGASICNTVAMTQPKPSGSPTFRRIKLGRLLSDARRAAGLTTEAVAEALMTNLRNVQRWEKGETVARPSDLNAMCNLYEVSTELRAEIMELAKEGRQRGWWVEHGKAIRRTFTTFLGLEAEATSYMQYAATVIPGLLQTEDYMRAIFAAEMPPLDDETIDSRVQVRLKRQSELRDRNCPAHFIIKQGALMDQVGGASVMQDQLEHLLKLAKNRLIKIQIVPFEAGAQSILWSFSVITFSDVPTVASVELMWGDLYEDARASEQYAIHFNNLREAALPEASSLALVKKIGEQHAQQA